MLRDFYEAVLPAQGYYALFQAGPNRHSWADSLDALTRQTERRLDDQGLYFATASFDLPTDRKIENALLRRAFCFDIDAGEKKYAKHGDKVYKTKRDALAALGQWCKLRGVTFNYLVSSGDGLHVYFTLDEDTEIAQWRPVANRLKALALHDGLRIDGGITGDPVRILRPPGTLHHSGSRVEVMKVTGYNYQLERFDAILDVLPRPAPTEPPRRRLNEEILVTTSGPPRSVEKVISRCEAMREAAESGGNVPEPYWRAMLGVIKFTVEGDEAAHKYSSGHPDYDYDETQTKLDRWTAGPTVCTTFGAENPQACAKCPWQGKVKSPIMLGELTAPEVEALPKQPEPEPQVADNPFPSSEDDDEGIPMTTAPAAVHEWSPYLPDKYKILPSNDGFVMHAEMRIKTKNVAGDEVERDVEVPFCRVPFWFEAWAPGYDDNDQAIALYAVYNAHLRKVHRYSMPTRALAKRDTLLAALAGQNVQAYPSGNMQKQAIEDYVKASMERIRAIGQRQKVVERFGTLYDNRGQLVVAQGKLVIHGNGTITEGVVHDNLRGRSQAYVVPVRDPNVGRWEPVEIQEGILPLAKRHAAYLDRFYSTPNFAPYQLAIMLAWASPLLAFTQGTFLPGSALPGGGLTVTLYSTLSGIGKTAAMHAAALAFGDPSALVTQLDRANSTDNARQHTLAQSGTLPCFMDEMEDLDPVALASLLSSVGNGVTKRRMTKDLGENGGKHIALVNIMSTNKSHREIAAAARSASDATQVRLLEIDCTEVLPVSADVAAEEARARATIQECAGAIGTILHWKMCERGGEALNLMCARAAEEARNLISGEQKGRFLWRTLGAALVARRLLAEAGVEVFSEVAIVREFQKWYVTGAKFAEDNILPTDPKALMSLCLSDLFSTTLVTRTETHRAGGSETKFDIPINDRVVDVVNARSVLDGRYVYVRTDAIKDWCERRQVGRQSLMIGCKDAGVFEIPDPLRPQRYTRQIDLLKGTKMAQGVRSTVVKILIDKLSDGEGSATGDNVVDLKRPGAPQGGSVSERTA